jgi:Terminase large subunit, T4likevirus-type, N-terminal
MSSSELAEPIITPTPKQAEFLACPAREVLTGGSSGGGKSTALLLAAVSQATNPQSKSLIVRRSYVQLRDLIGASFEIYKPLGAEFNKSERVWTFPSGATVSFGYLESDADKYIYQGMQFSCLCFDELTQLPQDGLDANSEPVNKAYLYLHSRLRAPAGSNLRLEIRAATNPGGVGHSWVKQRWGIEDNGGPSERRDPQTGYRRVFIPSKLEDNPALAATDYSKVLDALAENDRKALKEGLWLLGEGAVFSEWNPRLHVVPSFEIPDEWPMWRSCDDGFAAPCCVLWFAHDKIYDRIYVVNEIYARGLNPMALAQATLAIDRQYGAHRQMQGIIDSASFSDVGMGGGRANIMNAMGCRWQPSEKGQGSRIAGKAHIHERLAMKSDGAPGLQIFSNCRNLIRTIPALPFSPTNPEDIDSNSEDHAVDSLRYGLSHKKTCTVRMRLPGL